MVNKFFCSVDDISTHITKFNMPVTFRRLLFLFLYRNICKLAFQNVSKIYEFINRLNLSSLSHILSTSPKSRIQIFFPQLCCNFKPLRTVRPIYRTGVPLPSKCCILYIFFSTNISTEYFKHAAHSPFFS